MKLACVILVFTIGCSTFASGEYQDKFKKISIGKIAAVDLCSGKPLQVPADGKIELWSAHCGNCIEKIQDTKANELTLINVDRSPVDRAEACQMVSQLGRKSLSDPSNSIKNQIGGDFPVPIELTLHQKIIDKVTVGYWRASSNK